MSTLKAVASAIGDRLYALSHADDGSVMKMRLENGRGILGTLKREADGANALYLDWMKEIPDNRPLFQLSVPGTHDSAAYNYTGPLNEFWNCQKVSLFRQLDAGIRALDLRYGLREGKLLFFHSTACLDEKAEVVDIIWGLHAWLEEHPQETIFVSLKVDNGEPKNTVVQSEMGKVLENTRDLWVSALSPHTTLAQARGKLVLVRRFPFPKKVGYSVSENWIVNSECFDIPLTDDGMSMARIEDFYLLKGLAKNADAQITIKYDYTTTHLERAQAALHDNPKDLYITFTSAVGDRANGTVDEDVTPRVMALGRGEITGVNQRLIEWLQKSEKKPVGIVFMDFATTRRTESARSKDDGDEEEEEETKLIHCFIEKQMSN